MENEMKMAWNEPGNRGSQEKPKSPWGSNKGNDGGPPDLDKILRNFVQNLKNLFTRTQKTKGPQIPDIKPWGGLIVGIVVAIYIFSGIYVVDPSDRAVVTRFGSYVRSEEPGIHWLPLMIESKEAVNVEQMQTSEHRGLMLTRDENIGSVEVVVYYQIVDPKDYLFNVINPLGTLKQAAESALRQVVGQSTLNEVLTGGQIAPSIKKQIIATLKNYDMGVAIFDVMLKTAKGPEEVQTAFDDVIRAREEAERFINQAKSYANDVVPKAEAKAGRINQEALAYQQETELNAEGNANRFNQIVTQYQKAPKVTQSRLYLETMEAIFSKNNKVMVDSGKEGNNLIYIPLDKLMSQGKTPENSAQQKVDKEKD